MTEKLGAKSVGPAGWVAIAGTVLNGALYALSQETSLLPSPWNQVVIGVISVLTILGVYRAPNQVQK